MSIEDETQTTVYEHTDVPSGLSEEAYEQACKDFAANEKEFLDLTVCLESCSKNLKFIARIVNDMNHERKVQARAMESYLDQRKECRVRKEKLLKILGLAEKYSTKKEEK